MLQFVAQLCVDVGDKHVELVSAETNYVLGSCLSRAFFGRYALAARMRARRGKGDAFKRPDGPNHPCSRARSTKGPKPR